MIPQSRRCHTILWLAPDPFSTTLPVPRDKHAPGGMEISLICLHSGFFHPSLSRFDSNYFFFTQLSNFAAENGMNYEMLSPLDWNNFEKAFQKMFKLIASCLHEFYKYWSLNPQVIFITILYGTKSHSLYP